MALLQTIPGVNWIAAATIIAEIGVDMCCFPSAAHLVSWAGSAQTPGQQPGNNQRGANRRSGPTTDGNRWLPGLQGEVVWGAIRKKGVSFGARYRRLARRHNKQKAVVASMHHLVVVTSHVLRNGVPYRELAPTTPKRLIRRAPHAAMSSDSSSSATRSPSLHRVEPNARCGKRCASQ
jgi:transposase